MHAEQIRNNNFKGKNADFFFFPLLIPRAEAGILILREWVTGLFQG